MGTSRTIFRARNPFLPREATVVVLGLGALAYDVIDRGNVMGWTSTITVAIGFLLVWAALAWGIRWLDRGRLMRVDLDGETLTLFSPTGQRRSVAVSQLANWRYDRVEDTMSRSHRKTLPAFLCDDQATGKPVILRLDRATIDLQTFLALAPRAVAGLDAEQSRPNALPVSLRDLSSAPVPIGASGLR